MQLISIRWRLDQESRNGVQDINGETTDTIRLFLLQNFILIYFFPVVANRTTFLIIASGFIYQSCPFSLLVLLFFRKLELGPFVVQVIWRTLQNQMGIFNRNKNRVKRVLKSGRLTGLTAILFIYLFFSLVNGNWINGKLNFNPLFTYLCENHFSLHENKVPYWLT